MIPGWFFIVPGEFLWLFMVPGHFFGSRFIFRVFQDSWLFFYSSRLVFMVFQGSGLVFHGSKWVFKVLGWGFMVPGGFEGNS